MRALLDKGGQFPVSRVAMLVWLAVAVVVLLWGLAALVQAGRLQAVLGSEQAERQLRGSLEARLAAEGADGLQAYVRALVGRGAMGLRYLAIRVPGGTKVAEAGAYDDLSVPMISPLYVERLRETMLEQAGPRRRFEIRRDGREVARVEYILAAGAAQAVRSDAVSQLQLQGWLLIAAGAALLGLGAWTVMRPLPPVPASGLKERVHGERASAPPRSSPEPASLEGRAAQALDRLQRGVIVVDADIRIRDINRVAEQLTGWSRDDAVGRLVYSVFHPLADDDQPLTTPAETAVRERCETPAQESRLRARDGTMHHIEMAAAVLENGAGQAEGAVLFFHDIGERRESVERLRADARRTQDIVDHLDEGVLTTDEAGVITFANARAARMFGYRREELVGATVTKLMPVPFLNMPEVRVRDYSDSQTRGRLPRVVGWRRDATTFPVDLQAQTLAAGDAGEAQQVLVLRDLTLQLRKDNLSLRMGRLFDHAAEEIYVFDAQSLYFTEVNRAAQRNLQLEDGQLARMTPAMITEGIEAEALQDYYLRLRSGQTEHVRYRARHRRADGSSYPVEVRLSYSRAEEPPVFMAMVTDCSEREAAEARLARQAMQDDLTGLANRPAAMNALREHLRNAVQRGEDLAVIFFDLDHFKRVNDRYGHETGDAVLREVAQRLDTIVREGHFVARLSGDEIVVFFAGSRGREQVEAFSERLRRLLNAPIVIAEQRITITASLGVAVFRGATQDPVEPGDILSQADRAMYLAKKAGRNRIHIYYGEEPAAGEQRKA